MIPHASGRLYELRDRPTGLGLPIPIHSFRAKTTKRATLRAVEFLWAYFTSRDMLFAPERQEDIIVENWESTGQEAFRRIWPSRDAKNEHGYSPCFLFACETDTEEASKLNRQAAALFSKGEVEKALRVARKALELDPAYTLARDLVEQLRSEDHD